MKAALPPLQPSKTTQQLEGDPIKFTDFGYKNTLIEKARTTVTTLDLNDIISELAQIYEQDTEAMRKLVTLNEIKNREFKIEQEKFDALKTEYENICQNTAIIDLLKKKNISGRIKSLEKSVTEVDKERLFHNPPPMTANPKAVISANEPEIMKYLHLVELNFKEIEALVYLLKRRSVSVDEGDRSMGKIRKEFGSINALLATVENLRRENQHLKDQEAQFIDDSMTKRRAFARGSAIGNRSIVTVLQAYLDDLYQYSAFLGSPAPRETSNSFDDLCPDKTFREATAVTFEDMEGQAFKAPGADIMSAMEGSVSSARSSYDKLVNGEGFGTDVLPEDFPDIPVTPVEKLMKSNAECFNGIRKKLASLEQKNDSMCEMGKRMLDMITEKREYERNYASLLNQIRELRKDHAVVLEKTLYNRAVTDSLHAIVCAFGRSLTSGTIDESVRTGVKGRCVTMENETVEATGVPLEKRKKKTKMSMAIMLQGNRNTSRMENQTAPDKTVVRKPVAHVMSKFEKELSLLVDSKPYELWSALELCTKIDAESREKNYEQSVVKFTQNNLTEVRKAMADDMQEMGEMMKEKIAVLRQLEDSLLRKQYFSKFTQTVGCKTKEAGSQIDEPVKEKK